MEEDVDSEKKYPIYPEFVDKLFVSVCPFECSTDSNIAEDLRTMGDVAKLEYDCIATYFERFNKLPEFNDKDRSFKSDKNMKMLYSGK